MMDHHSGAQVYIFDLNNYLLILTNLHTELHYVSLCVAMCEVVVP